MSPVNILPIVTVTARLFQSEAKKNVSARKNMGMFFKPCRATMTQSSSRKEVSLRFSKCKYSLILF